MSMRTKIIIDGEQVTDSELERTLRIVETYTADTITNEPYATVAIEQLQNAARSLPRSVEDWLDEYPNA